MTREESIKAEYASGECDALQAIEALQESCAMTSHEAEALVERWEDEKPQPKPVVRTPGDEGERAAEADARSITKETLEAWYGKLPKQLTPREQHYIIQLLKIEIECNENPIAKSIIAKLEDRQ